MQKSSKHIIIYTSILAVICMVLAWGNPHSISWPLKCPLFHLTGFQCPFCGMQRAVHELLNGNIKGAWLMNPGFFLLMPYWVLLACGQIFPDSRKSSRLVSFCYHGSVVCTAFIYLFAWCIIRNIYFN